MDTLFHLLQYNIWLKKKKEIQQASLEIKESITKNQRLKDMTKQAPKPMGDQNLLKRFLSRY